MALMPIDMIARQNVMPMNMRMYPAIRSWISMMKKLDERKNIRRNLIK